MNDTKLKIEDCVREYQRIFAVEYQQFLKAKRPQIEYMRLDNKHAKLKGAEIVERQLGEIPATLFAVLKRSLSDAEWQWFQTLPSQRWFFNSYPQYAVAGGKL